jgi:hypothetical protein
LYLYVTNEVNLVGNWNQLKVFGVLYLWQLDSLDGLDKVTTEDQRDKFREELSAVSTTFNILLGSALGTQS